jgi:predicted aspartyl protease
MGIHQLPDRIVTEQPEVTKKEMTRRRQAWRAHEIKKAMRGRIALQSTACELQANVSPRFAQLWECARVSRRFHVRDLAMRVLMLLVLATAPPSIFGTAKSAPLPQPAGYKTARVHYGPLNKMIMSVRVNGQPANLLVDTGANQIILDADAAESFGVRPSQRGLRYLRFTQIHGKILPVGFAQSLTAGSMNFGRSPVALRSSTRSDNGNAHIDGMLGLDILLRHKAVINCRTRIVFFKVDRSRPVNLAAVASSQNFTKVPLRREENGVLTVPCSIHGQPGHLVVDTGAFVTTFHETVLKSLGITSAPTRVSARFSTGATQHIGAGEIDDLAIGDFKLPPGKFGVAALPRYALQQGGTIISGILGIDTLYKYQAIIDLDSMNLFLR